MKRNILPPGIISLAVVFVCLCLTVLSLLCYTSAKSELSLAEASAANKKKVLEGSFMCRGLRRKQGHGFDAGPPKRQERRIFKICRDMDARHRS